MNESWRRIDSIMSMMALGAFTGVLWVIAVSLFTAGFYICHLGFREAAISAWVGSAIFFFAGLIILRLFIRACRRQKRIEDLEDWKG